MKLLIMALLLAPLTLAGYEDCNIYGNCLDDDSNDDGSGFSGSWNDLTDIPAGFADNVDNTSTGGTDWTEITSIPAGFDDDVDNVSDGLQHSHDQDLNTTDYVQFQGVTVSDVNEDHANITFAAGDDDGLISYNYILDRIDFLNFDTGVLMNLLAITDSILVTNNITIGGFFVGDGSHLTDVNYTETDPFWTANSTLVPYLAEENTFTNKNTFQSGNGQIVTSNSAGTIVVQTSGGNPGSISFGNTADLGISQDGVSGGYDYDGAFIFKQKTSNPAEIGEYIWIEENGNWRFALPSSGADYGTYNPRSMIIAGPSENNASNFECSYWGFSNLDCNTGGTGADLGVQDDLEVLGLIYGDGSQLTGIPSQSYVDSISNHSDNHFNNISQSYVDSVGNWSDDMDEYYNSTDVEEYADTHVVGLDFVGSDPSGANDILFSTGLGGIAWGKQDQIDHNELSGHQGGSASNYYHLTSTQHTTLTGGGDADSLHEHPDYRELTNHTFNLPITVNAEGSMFYNDESNASLEIKDVALGGHRFMLLSANSSLSGASDEYSVFLIDNGLYLRAALSNDLSQLTFTPNSISGNQYKMIWNQTGDKMTYGSGQARMAHVYPSLAGSYSGGKAYVCVFDNGTLFASDSAC